LLAELRDGWKPPGLQLTYAELRRGPKPPSHPHSRSFGFLLLLAVAVNVGPDRLIDHHFLMSRAPRLLPSTAPPVPLRAPLPGLLSPAGLRVLLYLDYKGSDVTAPVTWWVAGAMGSIRRDPEGPSPCSWAISTCVWGRACAEQAGSGSRPRGPPRRFVTPT